MLLTVQGLKGRDTSVSIADLVMLVGHNGAGKSTLLDGLRFLAIGWIPALGKRPIDTASLLRDREATVRLDMEDGRWCERRLERAGRSLTTSCHASWIEDAAAQKEHDAAILGLFGDTEESVAEALDLRVLLSLSPNARAQRLTALLESVADPGATVSSITRYGVQQLGGISEERMPEAIADACPLVPGFRKDGGHVGQYAALKAAIADVRGLVAGDGGLAAALTHAKDRKNGAVADVRTKTAARKELEDRLATLPAANDDDLEGLELRRARLEQEIGAQRERTAEHQRRQQNVVDATRALNSARVTAAAVREEREAVERQLVDLAVKRERIDAIDALLAAAIEVPLPDESAADALEEEAAQAQAQGEEIRKIIPQPVDVSHYERGVEDLRAKVAAAESNPWSEVDEIGASILADAKGSSERIERLRRHAERLRELAASSGGSNMVDLGCQLTAAETELERVRAHAVLVGDKRSTLTDVVERWRYKAASKSQEARALREKIRADYAAATQAQRSELADLRHERTTLATAVLAIETRDRRTSDRFIQINAELAAAEQRMADLGPTPEPAAEENLIPELAAVQRQIADAQGATRLREQFTGILAEIEAAETAVTVWRAVEQACTRTRNEQVAEQGAPLLERMRVFFAAAGRLESPFLRAAKNECAIGWTRVTKEILVESMSGGEWVVYVAALVAGMLALRSAPLRVLLVEAGEVDDANTTALLRGISAVADDLSHAIVCRPERPSVAVQGWTVIEPATVAGRPRAAA